MKTSRKSLGKGNTQKERTDIQKSSELSALILKGDAYWRRIPDHYTDIITNHQIVTIFYFGLEEDCKSSNPNESMVSSDDGRGVARLLEQVDKVNEFKGYVIVSLADPVNFIWGPLETRERKVINLNEYYSALVARSGAPSNPQINKMNNSKMSNSKIEEEEKENSMVEPIEEEWNEEYNEEELEDGVVETSFAGSKKNEENVSVQEIKPADEGKKAPPAEYLIGYPAWLKLSYATDSAELYDHESVILIKYKSLSLFLVFEDLRIAKDWGFGMKFLLKTMDINYRGINHMLSAEKKNIATELTNQAFFPANINSITDDYRILLDIYDPDKDGRIWRDLKYTFWSKNGIYDQYAIYNRFYENIDEIIAQIKEPIKDQHVIPTMIFNGFLDQIHIDEFNRECNNLYPAFVERTKYWRFTNEKDTTVFVSDFSQKFWDIRRGILKNYKKSDGERSQSLFDMIITSEQSWEDNENDLKKAFKILELQKHDLRLNLHKDAKNRGRKRGNRGGKWRSDKAKRKEQRKARDVEKKTNLVLRLMMFKESNPEILPDEFQKLSKSSSKSYRDNCTCKAF
ncbi:unnamed protein product [Blepharisma stoltei]|uniref:EF-hand domain-containing protein n=1 Tax=Blepharisma stoltei TaxID=1481888 RepID=A0AAU9J5V5_9CILI|nr:unnamed protein product [Blepharisma stoltei]